LPAPIAGQLGRERRPVDLLQGVDLAGLIGRNGGIHDLGQRQGGVVEVGMPCQPPHQGIAALIAEVHVEHIVRLVDDAHIDGSALNDGPRRLVTVVVALVFELEPEGLPGGLVLYPSIEGRRAMEQAAEFKLAAAAREAVITLTPAFTDFTEGVLDVAALTHVSPRHSQGEIKVLVAFAGDDVFAVKEPGPHHIAQAHRDLWAPGGFGPESGFDIQPLVLVGLVATEILVIAVEPGANVGVSQGGFQPGEWLHGDGPAPVFLVIHVVE